MAFTTTDLDQVEQAIMELVNGVCKVCIETDGNVKDEQPANTPGGNRSPLPFRLTYG